MKELADLRNKAKPNDIQEGDNVLIRNEVKENKTTPSFNPSPQTVVKKKGTMITVSDNNGKSTTRKTFFFKKTNHSAKFSDQMDEEEELDNNTHLKEKNETNTPIQSRPTRIRKPPSYLQNYECKVRWHHNP
jgi:hypothetical protein